MTGISPPPPAGGQLRRLLLAVCGVDAVIQLAAIAFPNPFQGLGILVLPLAPFLLVWYGSVLLAAVGGIALVVACAMQRRLWIVGAVIGVLSFINLTRADRFLDSMRSTPEDQAASADCARRVDTVRTLLAAWYAVPRRVVAVESNVLTFEGGPSIDACVWGDRRCWNDDAGIERRKVFGRFVSEHVVGSEVVVRLPAASAFHYYGTNWCDPGAAPLPTVVDGRLRGIYVAEIYFRGKRLTVTGVPPNSADFPPTR